MTDAGHADNDGNILDISDGYHGPSDNRHHGDPPVDAKVTSKDGTLEMKVDFCIQVHSPNHASTPCDGQDATTSSHKHQTFKVPIAIPTTNV
ncbi:hypothetical protein Forpe1208_v011850 [Fusarium oxysporum f. sp. rapae]|uniref:Uncharacterized protein n=1 Tax=Fusarium oxysporum f. sp. rapae TaxID=485398 RepID=A0A8J5NVN9_FUSOX|nr:hypothetical protein Forpe1208_v011850 [Fusarium oxysporum f. sp. rapae]